MRKIFVMLLLCITTAMGAQNKSYTINGQIATPQGANAYVVAKYLNKADFSLSEGDTIKLTNSTFTLKGEATDDGSVAVLIPNDEALQPVVVYLEAGNTSVLFDEVSRVQGTPLNEKFQIFNDGMKQTLTDMNALRTEYEEAEKAGKKDPEFQRSIEQKYEKLANQVSTNSFNFLKENIGNTLGEFLFFSVAGNLNLDQITELLALSRPQFKETSLIKDITASLAKEKALDVGGTYLDITLNDEKGNPVTLSDYVSKNKVTLIDFWASWCGPCRKEMPNVVDAYAKYKDKGFEIVGISLDDSKDAWVKGIKSMKMTWINVSDLGGWKSQAAQLYGIKSIPTTLLVDSEGKIVAKNLRGTALLDKLESLLN